MTATRPPAGARSIASAREPSRSRSRSRSPSGERGGDVGYRGDSRGADSRGADRGAVVRASKGGALGYRRGAWIGATIAIAVAACAPPSEADDPAAVPPLAGQDAIEAWFAEGHYLAWPCEAAPREPTDASSPHGRMRVCANAIAMSAGVDQVDASIVAELVDASGAVVGRGAQRHTGEGRRGDAWYWYMRVPPASATVHDDRGLAADGWGFGNNPAKDYCVPCHRSAGDGHPGDDFVFVTP